MTHLYRTGQGILAVASECCFLLRDANWDGLIRRDDLAAFLEATLGGLEPVDGATLADFSLQAPIGSQEVWAAGVTYYRSRDARMEESKDAGGGSFYDRVYDAQRPELFMKATPHRVSGPGGEVRIRADSRWNVPEPELTLVLSAGGIITGFTVGNDMSSRDIEGENPLYLPQAKTYDGCCALGPGILVRAEPLPSDCGISISIRRDGTDVFSDSTTLASLKRRPEQLVEFLFRDNSFPDGCFLMTGTGIVPPAGFTLEPGDEVSITIDDIGTLTSTVRRGT